MLKDKAQENLDAGVRLVDATPSRPNAAMSRLYYALYQAALHCHEKASRKFFHVDATASKWTHELVRNSAALLRGKTDDVKLFTDALAQRVTADYKHHPVEIVKVKAMLPKVEEFVRSVCK